MSLGMKIDKSLGWLQMLLSGVAWEEHGEWGMVTGEVEVLLMVVRFDLY